MSRRARVSVISLNNEGVVSSIFGKLGRTTPAHRALRRGIFMRIAGSARLQHMMLDALSLQPGVQRKLLRELAKTSPRLKSKLFAVAGEEKRPRVAPKLP